MRLRKLSGNDFRRYRTFDVDFAPGLTVIRGPNESGKTTLQRALELALTRRATSTAGELEALRPWGAPPEARSVITVVFEQDEEDGQKVGTLEKTFAGSRGTVLLDYDGQSISDPTLADQVMVELTGIPTEGFFRSTASIRHFELSDLSRDEGALRDRLQASISGADRGTSRARRKLDRALHDLTTRGDRNPGRLKVAEQAVEQAQIAVEQGELALAQLERDRDTLSTARERRATAEAALAERRSMLDKARQAERITAERTVAAERFDRYREAVEISSQLVGLADTHPSPNPLPVLRTAVERLRTLDGRIRELKAALSGEVAVEFDVAPEPTWRPLSRVSIALVVIGILIAAGPVLLKGLGIADPGFAVQAIGGIVAIIGLALAAVALWLRRSARLQAQLRDVEIDRRLRGRSDMEAELKDAEARVASQLAALGLPGIADAEELMTREENHVAQIERLTAQLEGLVGKDPPGDLQTVRDEAALEISQKTSALEALGPIAKEPRARERLEVEVRDQETALEHARDDEANARARVEANAVDAEQVAGQAERLAAWREQLAALQRRQRVFAATLEAIDRAEQATMKTATRYLEEHMVRDLAEATGGRYRRVRVDDRTLDIEVHAPEKDDWVPVSSLSQGTVDLVYLIARLGLVRLVTGDRRPPLIFDDPFVTLDDTRATNAVALLRKIAADFQVIYLTTSPRYDASADAVVLLDGPTVVDGGEPAVVSERPAVGSAAASAAAVEAHAPAPAAASCGAARLIDLGGPATATVVFGLASAVAWGFGDFGGGLLTRRTALFGVVLVSQLVGMGLAVVLTLLRGETTPSPLDLGWSVLGGVAGATGISALYQALAVGRMGIVAPVTGVIAAIIPVGAGIVLEGVPPPLVLAGILLAIVAVVLVSRSDSGDGGRSGLGLALLAGLGIGALSVCISQISDGHVFGPLVVIRATQAVFIVGVILLTRSAWRVERSLLPATAAVGVLDMAGNGMFILAVQSGALAVAAVLSSLYPVTTVILATVVLRERITRSHAVGIVLAAVAVAAIAAGSAAG